ncbi:MAG: 16S rRNA (uracil(1498)-N(3))-methyltransferase [Spirochaetaceae bacterium]|jgi:16S rRNA (uracil1498-N3)-methyltransferase|nr:16S rRNA (uracil(1498)-N(3))-methyltransferase [Spirochaetaceae bacterium]
MKQFILREYPDKNGDISLGGKDFHYLVRVRRMRKGDVFDCRLPSGEAAVLRVTAVEKNTLAAKCTLVKEVYTQTSPAIILFQSMVKGAKMDLIVRQAGETGVTEIVPFYSGHSVPRDGKNPDVGRLGRWLRILDEARKQSGSAIVSNISAPRSREQLFSYWEQMRSLHEESLALLVHEIPLANMGFHQYLETVPELVVLAVGPEGGFSPDEAGDFVKAGFKPVTLGSTILRAESAALYSTAVVRTLIFERQTWTVTKI